VEALVARALRTAAFLATLLGGESASAAAFELARTAMRASDLKLRLIERLRVGRYKK
jgi:hypothetical protein